jgi:hypothetical protein
VKMLLNRVCKLIIKAVSEHSLTFDMMGRGVAVVKLSSKRLLSM